MTNFHIGTIQMFSQMRKSFGPHKVRNTGNPHTTLAYIDVFSVFCLLVNFIVLWTLE